MIPKRSIAEITKTANQGNADAQFQLGLCYYAGKGVRKNYTKAATWIRKSAEQGHERAQYHLWWCKNWI